VTLSDHADEMTNRIQMNDLSMAS